MQYIFPRQFGLHNVFTSDVDVRETVQPFKDYTIREQEIALHQRQIRLKGPSSLQVRLPKRLRGQAVTLVKKLQKLHNRCSYAELLGYYCPYVGALYSFQLTGSLKSASVFLTGSNRPRETIKLKISKFCLPKCRPVMI